MSWLGDVLDFEKFNGKGIVSGIAKKPVRLIRGEVDPASTGLWNGITGSKDHALVDQMGGATGKTYSDAQASGINTGPGHKVQNVAHVIAGLIAGGELSGMAGAGGEGVASGADGVGGGADLSSASLAGDGAGNAGFVFNPAQDSQLANQQLGLNAVTTDDTLASSGSTSNYGKNVQKFGNAMQDMAKQQQERQRQLQESNVAVDTPRLYNPYATSSKRAKTAPTGSVNDAMRRGVAGSDAIDANGMQIAAIQEITKRLQVAQKRLAELKRSKGK